MAPSVQRRKVWLTPTTRVPCSNAVKTRNPLKLAGVPQTNETISSASGPKFTILWGQVEVVLLLNKFFPIVDTCLSSRDIARQSCGMVPRWRFFASFFRPVFFSEPRAAHYRPAFKIRTKATPCVEVPLRLGAEKEEERNKMELECGPLPNVMVALPNTGGALCSTSQSLADAHY